MRKRYWIIAIVVFHVIMLGSGYLFFKDKNSAGRYVTEKIDRGLIKEEISATGNLEALITVSVGSQVSGTIKELLADYNSTVAKDQIVATLEPSIFMAQRKQAEANLSSAQANLENAEVALNEAARNLKRGKELFADNLISDSEMDGLQAAYESARANVSVAQSQVKQAEASLSLAKVNLGHTIIRSPVDGVVISRNVDAGQTVAASLQAPTLFTIANDLTKMQVHADIPESDVGKIKEGQEVTFRVDAFPKELFHGQVSQVRNEGVIVQNVVTYDAVIDVNNEDLKLKPGMTAYVAILVASREDALKVPNQALRFKPSDFEKRMEKRAKTSQAAQTQEQQAGGEQAREQKSQMTASSGAKDHDLKTQPAKSAGSKKPINKKGHRRSTTGSKPIVWIKEGNAIKPVEIQIGITNGKFTEVVKGDLSEGAEVVVEEEYSQDRSGRMPRFRRRF